MSALSVSRELGSVSIAVVEAAMDIAVCLDIRYRVFVLEQAVPKLLEFDCHDNTATHFLLRCGNMPAGTCRVRLLQECAKIERVAFLPEFRRQGLGHQLMQAALEYMKTKKQWVITLNAQQYAVPFYEKLGFRITDALAFEEAGIMHNTMIHNIKQ
jgi:predicted GNAT family N-acyltransferase